MHEGFAFDVMRGTSILHQSSARRPIASQCIQLTVFPTREMKNCNALKPYAVDIDDESFAYADSEQNVSETS